MTGGTLRTDKSWWYLIEYVWKHRKWVASDPELDIDSVATEKHGERVGLSHFKCAAEILRVWLAPNGNRKNILSVSKAATFKWGGNVSRGNSFRQESWTALHTNKSIKIKYSLPSCTLKETECKSIMYPVIRAGLPKSGITASIITEVRTGSSKYGREGVLSLF